MTNEQTEMETLRDENARLRRDLNTSRRSCSMIKGWLFFEFGLPMLLALMIGVPIALYHSAVWLWEWIVSLELHDPWAGCY